MCVGATFLCGGSFHPRGALPGKHRAKDGAPTCFDSVLALHRVARQSAQGGDGIVLRQAVQCTFRCFSIFGGTLLAVFPVSYTHLDVYKRQTLDNVEALQRWPEVFRGRELWLRVDLGRGDGHHAKVRTGGKDSKFGLPISKIDQFLELARGLDIRIIGLHAHLGSGVETPQHWRLVCDELGGIAERIGSIQTIDIGGGLPIPYTDCLLYTSRCV